MCPGWVCGRPGGRARAEAQRDARLVGSSRILWASGAPERKRFRALGRCPLVPGEVGGQGQEQDREVPGVVKSRWEVFPAPPAPPPTCTRGGGTSAIREGLWRTEQEDRSWET